MEQSFGLAVFDLDGTLLDDNKCITARAYEAIQEIRSKVPVVLATARPPRDAIQYWKQLNLDTPCILYNGALIFDMKHQYALVSHVIDPLVVIPLMDYLQKISGVHNIVAECSDKLWARWLDSDVAYWTHTGGSPPDIGYPFPFIQHSLSKLLIRGNHVELLPILKKKWIEQLQFTFSDPAEVWLEIMSINAGKASAVRWLADYYGVNMKNVIAFGDSENDLGMLQEVGYGVAMGNATHQVRTQAKRVTLTNQQDGVAVLLEEVFSL